MKKLFVVCVLGGLVSPAFAGDAVKLTTQEQKFSYAVGYGIGKGMQQNGIEVDISSFSAAVKDALEDKKPRLTQEQMAEVARLQQEKELAARKAIADENAKKGRAFLEKNSHVKGVVTLDSGLQYKVIREGKGRKPTANDTVSVNYTGRLIDGKVFDSSYDRGVPATFPVQGVIKGWQEGIQMMKEGAKWQLFIPSELAYGDAGAGGAIGPGETLIFDVELLEIK